MATITNITLQKIKSRANIFLNGEFVCGLNNITIVKNGLKIGTVIQKENLLKIYNESEMEGAYEKALSLLSRQKYTKKAIVDKLKAKGYDAEIIENVINKLAEYGYINDEDFVKSFVNCNTTKSRRAIEANLMQKGIKREVIKEVLEDSTTKESEREKCVLASQKYMKNKILDDSVAKKLKAHLMYKGFMFEDILYAIKQLGGEIDYD